MQENEWVSGQGSAYDTKITKCFMTKSIVSIQKKGERCNEKKKSQKKIDGKENISPYRKFFISMYIAHTHTFHILLNSSHPHILNCRLLRSYLSQSTWRKWGGGEKLDFRCLSFDVDVHMLANYRINIATEIKISFQ